MSRQVRLDARFADKVTMRSVRARLHRQDHGDRRNLAARLQDRRRSDTDAKLTVYGAVNGISRRNSSSADAERQRARRRCERGWRNGDEIGVRLRKDLPAPEARG